MELNSFFERDLNKLIEEISLFNKEEDIWKIKPGVSNSAGNLTLHLTGNLKHFIGATLGKTGYVRDRDKEFTLKNIPREKLVEDINEVKKIIKNTLAGLSEEELNKKISFLKQNEEVTKKYMLIYLISHLSYHLGQINYLRRFIG